MFLLKYFYFESNIAIAERCGFTERKALMFLHSLLVWLQSYYLYSNYIAVIFFQDSYAVVWFWIYICFSIIGFYLLVYKGERKSGIYTVSSDFGSVVQYVLSIWIRIF